MVGGGAVGTRKALALAEAGASVRVIAPRVTAELEAAEHASRAVSALRELRLRLLARGGEDWRTAAPALLGEDFCEAVESGSFPDKVAAWR